MKIEDTQLVSEVLIKSLHDYEIHLVSEAGEGRDEIDSMIATAKADDVIAHMLGEISTAYEGQNHLFMLDLMDMIQTRKNIKAQYENSNSERPTPGILGANKSHL